MEENQLYQSNPSMWRNRPIWFLFCSLAVALYGLGLLLFIPWWIRCRGTTLTITDRRSILRRGILSKYTTEVLHKNVRNVQVGQTLGQRIFGVGRIGISSAGQAGVEIDIVGIPHPDRVKEFIDANR